MDTHPKIHESMQSALEDVTSLITKYRKLVNESPEKTYELEGRLGNIKDGHFSATVPRRIIDDAVTLVNSNKEMHSTDWSELQDFFYLQDNVPLRTRVSYNVFDLTIDTVTVKKVKLCHVTIACGTDLAVRISLSEEEVITSLPATTSTEHVRIQQRKSAYWSREKRNKPDWQYDFSLSWSGRNKSEAERAQNSTLNPTYEVEIELVSLEYLLRKTDEHIAKSLLCKLTDFLPRGSGLVFPR